MRIYYALWAFFYSLLQELGSLRPNFLHRFHGQHFRVQKRSDTSVDVVAVVEVVVAMICFIYAAKCYPTKEVIRKIRDTVNSDSELSRKRNLRNSFDDTLKAADDTLQQMHEEAQALEAEIQQFKIEGKSN